MIELMIAAALAQAADPCNAAGQPDGGRPGCPDWHLVPRTGPMTNITGYVDPASARRNGDILEIMTRNVLSQPGADGFSSFIARVRFDCARRTYMFVYFHTFNAAGVTLYEDRPAAPQPQPVLPNTGFNTMMTQFCAD